MSKIKELNLEELEKVAGGDNGSQPTFSNKVNDVSNCINEELYFTYSVCDGEYHVWFKGVVLSVSNEEKYGRLAEMVWVRVTDFDFGFTLGEEVKFDTIFVEIYRNKN